MNEMSEDNTELQISSEDVTSEEVNPLSSRVNVSTFEQLRAAVTQANSVPTTIYLMTEEILTGAGAAPNTWAGGATPIMIRSDQDITILNGLPEATSRVRIVRNISQNVTVGTSGPDTSTWGHENNRRSHEIFTVEGILRLGTNNSDRAPQANNITLDNLARGISTNAQTHPNRFNSPRTGIGSGQMRGGFRARGINAQVYMHDGIIVQYGRHEDEGGNIRITHGATLRMLGGIIRRGYGDATGGAGSGGGVFVAGTGSTMLMWDGLIEQNELSNAVFGGGVNVVGEAVFTMFGGIIRDHRLEGSSAGGGVGLGAQSGTPTNSWGGGAANSGVFNMHDGIIEENSATINGAGVWVNTGATFNMIAGTIRNNELTGANSNGGGVFTAATAAQNFGNINIGNIGSIDTSDQIHFHGNRSGAHDGSPLSLTQAIPETRLAFRNIRWDNWLNAELVPTTSVPIPSHLLNNWDVNIRPDMPYEVLQILTMVNGGVDAKLTGTLPLGSTALDVLIASESSHITLDAGRRPGYRFSHWTTVPEVLGIHDSANRIASGVMPNRNVVATAHWIEQVEPEDNCTICERVKSNTPFFVLNGMSEEDCQSLSQNQGLSDQRNEIPLNNCETLKDLVDCLIGRQAELLPNLNNICDMKNWLMDFTINLQQLLSTWACNECGQWNNLQAIQKQSSDFECQFTQMSDLENEANIEVDVTNEESGDE